ncbi:MAG TPA: bifunctional 4-hydroxy-2-oxoglutarate aldolase/2-dehydro-3-deoxy-phosphogluconate aldolase [Solirubrobacteraceae bacterium]|nr:bifunctional 4-hydroxy-2-oxoglutarate aldolase/2-dehydro-3-deoxy-phosphogluconate aldolase [Solirubrobacteraceae bacterium]
MTSPPAGTAHLPDAGADAPGDVLARIERCRVLPVVTADPSDVAMVGRALVAGGLPCIEIAFRRPDAADAVRAAAGVQGLLVGAGTLLSAQNVACAAAAGARFGVAPGLDEDVLACARSLSLPFIPGVATASEAIRARRAGANVMKVFPAAQLGGPGFVRALSEVFRDVRFIPTGGVDRSTLSDYLSLPSVLACGGSWVVSAADVRERAFERIAATAREIVSIASR